MLDRGSLNFDLGVDAQRGESPLFGGVSNGSSAGPRWAGECQGRRIRLSKPDSRGDIGEGRSGGCTSVTRVANSTPKPSETAIADLGPLTLRLLVPIHARTRQRDVQQVGREAASRREVRGAQAAVVCASERAIMCSMAVSDLLANHLPVYRP